MCQQVKLTLHTHTTRKTNGLFIKFLPAGAISTFLNREEEKLQAFIKSLTVQRLCILKRNFE